MSVKHAIAEELATIQQANGGMLRPADVVDFAKNEDTTLHSQFQWDDTKAAESYRLWQARYVIRMHVTVIGADTTPVRAFVSLSTDRKTAGGGYRTMAQVMSDDEARETLLADALRELATARNRYKAIKALAPVWESLEHVEVSLAEEARKAG